MANLANEPRPIRLSVHRTRCLLAAHFPRERFPTCFFLRLVASASKTAAGMGKGKMPPRCRRRLPRAMMRNQDERKGSVLFFIVIPSHDAAIKRFTSILFVFVLVHFSRAWKTDFCGLFALMIPQCFGDPITGFAHANQDTRRDPHLTVGHAPLSFGGPSTS